MAIPLVGWGLLTLHRWLDLLGSGSLTTFLFLPVLQVGARPHLSLLVSRVPLETEVTVRRSSSCRTSQS